MYAFSDASDAVVEHLLFALFDLIVLRLVGHAEQLGLQLGSSLQVWFGKDGLDVVAEAQVVDEVRVSDGLVVVFQATQLRVLETEVAQIQSAPELRLAHAP